MLTASKSLVARTALGLVALAGLAAAVPASAHPFDGYDRHDGGRDREWVQRDDRPVAYGYVREWRPAPVWYAYHPHFAHFEHRDDWRGR
jgi:hypothetical protein